MPYCDNINIMIRPKVRQFEYLVALDNQKSFSKAADVCNVTQSTLSAGIKDLENVLGQQLVNRAGRSAVSLTAFGSEVASGALGVLNDIDSIVASAQKMKSPLSGILRLGVIPTIAPYYLPHILPNLQKSFPDLQLQLYESLSADIISQLNSRQLDAAIIAFPYEAEGMVMHDLFKEDFYLAAPKDRYFPDSISVKDVDSDDLLLLEDGHCLRDHALGACKLKPSGKRKTFSATSLSTLIQMVAHGYGTTLLPEMVTTSVPNDIQLVPFLSPAPTRQIGMVWPSSSPLKRDLLCLLDAVRNIKI